MKKSVCFAYYADGKWIGWHSDTFGGVSNSPKVYSSFEGMRETIQKNLTNKINKINSTSFNEEKEKVEGLGGVLSLLTFDSEELLRGKEIELRAVECPEYNGPNDEFDKVKYEQEFDEHKKLWEAEEKTLGLFSGPSTQRSEAYNKFLLEHPYPKYTGWVYCDYTKVKEWAQSEPTEFIGILKP